MRRPVAQTRHTGRSSTLADRPDAAGGAVLIVH
jgi:hypothetical protein